VFSTLFFVISCLPGSHEDDYILALSSGAHQMWAPETEVMLNYKEDFMLLIHLSELDKLTLQ
jgi:hypothetical protein